MIKIPHTQEMLDTSLRYAADLGHIRNSIMAGRGNRAGYLAELALSAHLGAVHTSMGKGPHFDFDLVLGGKNIEVKTKRRMVDPRPYFEVSVAETSEHQQPDVYAFVSLTFNKKAGKGREKKYRNLSAIWLCGFMGREEYFQRATFLRKGEEDPSNGFTVLSDMYNLPIRDLREELV